MAPEDLFVVATVPAGLRAAVGADQIDRLDQAHPRVRVAVIDDPARFSELLPDADGVLLWGSFAAHLPPALEPGGRLRWVHSLPSGTNGVLTPELIAATHVTVTSSKGPMGPMMAEHTVLLMLALARDLPGYVHDQAARHWRPVADARPTVDLFGKTILIVGVGAVGGHLARICRLGFRMRVLGMTRTRRDDPHVDRYVDRAELPDALGQADFVVLTVPATPATELIIDRTALAAMRPTAYLINVARGGLVDEDALVEALRAGVIAGAGLDALTTEPLSADSPLWTLPNVIVTPHVAPGRDRFGAQLADFWCENIRRFAEGEPLLGAVDRHAGY